MEPEHYKFGGGATDSILHPLVLIAMLVAIFLMVRQPRRQAMMTFLCGALLIPIGQQFVVAGLHIFTIRILVLIGLLTMGRTKLRSRKPLLAGGWNSVDTAFTLAIILHAIAFSFLYLEAAAIVNQVGFIWDYLGGYLFLRYAIRNEKDIISAIKCLAVLTLIFAACMIHEQLTGENIFGLLGGIRLADEVREGHIRSEAVFQHAILAGTFGAIMLPLFVCLWKNTRSKLLGIVGVVSATIMTATTACSTPVLSLGAGVLAICMWPLRRRMRWLRWGIVMCLFGLSLLMRAPVWYVIAHAAVVGGSSAYHRADLVDTFIRHFGDWWLLGTKSNNSWGFEMFDTSNQYVQQGVTGGLFSLVFFVLTISRAFGRLGKARTAVGGNDRRKEWLLWFLGSALFVNVVAYFGISYFDQTRVAWFAVLAMIVAATSRSVPFVPASACEVSQGELREAKQFIDAR